MRIEAYTQVQNLYSTGKKAASQGNSGAAVSDEVQISSIGKDYQAAKAIVASACDVREDVIAPIKAKIEAGTYKVSGESFADKLLRKCEELEEVR